MVRLQLEHLSRSNDVNSPTPYSLLQVPPALLPLFRTPDPIIPLTIKGPPSSPAVLVTPSHTFQLKTVSSSNQTLLVSISDLNDKLHVIGQTEGTIETISGREGGKCRVALQNIMMGCEYEGSNKMKIGKSKSDIVQHVPCSEQELDELLRIMKVLNVGEEEGFMIFHDKYLADILVHVVKTIETLGVALDDFNLDDLKDVIDQDIVEPSLLPDLFSILPECSTTSLSPKSICRLIGLGHLTTVPPLVSTSNVTFLSQWYSVLPISLQSIASLPLLQPYISLDQETFIRLPLQTLPAEPKDLMRDLFGIKNLWEVSELNAILRQVLWTSEKEAEVWIAKWGRKSLDKGRNMISRKGI